MVCHIAGDLIYGPGLLAGPGCQLLSSLWGRPCENVHRTATAPYHAMLWQTVIGISIFAPPPGFHLSSAQPGERGRVQLCSCPRVFPAQEPHMSGVRDARTELVRLSQAEQVLAAASQVHQADPAAGAHGAAQTQGQSVDQSCSSPSTSDHRRTVRFWTNMECWIVYVVATELLKG